MNFFIDRGRGALNTSDQLTGERWRLSLLRIRQMQEEELVCPVYVPYFKEAAKWILLLLSQRRTIEEGTFWQMPVEELQECNRMLYQDIFPENYENSWANPGRCIRAFGKKAGPVMSALFYELRCMIPLVYESDAERFLIRMELLLEIYFSFVTSFDEYKKDHAEDHTDKDAFMEDGAACPGAVPSPVSIRGKIRQFLSDYAEEETCIRTRRNFTDSSIAGRILNIDGNSEDPSSGYVMDPRDPRCLFRYGAYISSNETEIFRYLEDLEEDMIRKMADTWTEGFRIGFAVTGKDLSIRSNAGLFYHIGFEKIARLAAQNLKAAGLKAVVPGQQDTLFTRNLGRGGGGIESTSPNPQYEYDHREDLALFFNDVLRGRRIEALQAAYRDMFREASAYAGPLVMETFGDNPFSPRIHGEYAHFTPSQQKKIARFRQEADLLYDRAVIGKERSFTIIAFPIPEITRGYGKGGPAASFDEIFRAVAGINTLDYMTYRDVQARIIDVLNTAESIYVRGRGENRTELTVGLQVPDDPEHQTIFENCVADVNIPVGEVFTTPRLKGTDGLLHVTRVYLNGLLFEDLALSFKDGRITDYSCRGFDDPAQGKRYIEENILFHHETLPMGECAIGTNTTACAESARLGIQERLPILIAEKTGPHFAVGDTCYSHEEENRMFNPDGKEIFAKENDYSLLRDTQPEKAYFGCHTDITLPYEEVGLLAAVRRDGTRIPVIRDGLFVLDGTEFLNEPLLRQKEKLK